MFLPILPNFTQITVFNMFWLGFGLGFIPAPPKPKKQSRFFSMIRANTNKCFAGCSNPLLKYIGCAYITYPSLSEVTVSLEALLGLWHFVRQASRKFNSQRYYCQSYLSLNSQSLVQLMLSFRQLPNSNKSPFLKMLSGNRQMSHYRFGGWKEKQNHN